MANANGITTGRNKLGVTFVPGLFALTVPKNPLIRARVVDPNA